MFERFTERARRTLFFARYEASQLGSISIETEHVLLGLIREGTGLTQHIFASLQILPQQVREEIEARSVFRETISTSVEIPFSAEVKRIFQHAAEEADRLLHNYIGAEHLLLGVLREEHSVAGSILKAKGMRLDLVRETFVTLLNTNPRVLVEASVPMQIHDDPLRRHADENFRRRARHRIFESRTKQWDDLCNEATEFANQIGPEKIISISVAASGGTEVVGRGELGLIVVWYWE